MSDCPNIVACCPPDLFGGVTAPPPVVIYWNVEKTASASCPAPTTGGPFSATVPAGTYSSYKNQDDADAQAQSAANAAANSQLSGCVPPIIQGQLSGLYWLMDCTNGNQPCSCVNPADQTVTLQGEAGHVYTVKLRLRGVVELFGYVGGNVSPDSAYCYIDPYLPPPYLPGNVLGGYTGNTYALKTSSPNHAYYLNNIPSTWGGLCVLIDYEITIPMAGGATITLATNSGDGLEVRNSSGLSVVPGIGDPPLNAALLPQPLASRGQFIQVDVTSVTY